MNRSRSREPDDAQPDARTNADLVELAVNLAPLAEAFGVTTFLEQALAAVQSKLGVLSLAIVRAQNGHWESLAVSGKTSSPLPWDLLSDAADEHRVVANSQWCVVPMLHPGDDSELLLAERGSDAAELSLTTLPKLAPLLASLLGIVRQRHQLQQRVARQEAILQIAGTWNRTLELEELLVQMAEASTKLLQSERASIFLWDRPLKTLVARPALGVKGGELRIPDHQGVVGDVVRSGATRVVDAGSPSEIDRSVDKQLRFHTRNLLCAPLKAANGRILGAFEMINKREGNFDADDVSALEELARHAAIAIENSQQNGQLLKARNQWADQAAEGIQLIGNCPPMQLIRNTIERVGPTDLSVLILGENGTGKEVVAQLVHASSPRRHHPFIAINCAALPETLLESELFGHEKGAFTDARETRPGKFEQAAGGTLFLDEIGDLSPNGQSKLLRVLEEKIVFRIGGQQPIHADTRVIAATNQNLVEMVRQRKFREDLYYRLHVVAIELPPLRDRGDDIVQLAEHFLVAFCAKARRRPPSIAAETAHRLRSHRWPGNVRELRNVMERIAFLSQESIVHPTEVSFTIAPQSSTDHDQRWDLPLADATRDFQIEYIQRQIHAAGNRMTLAAEKMGLHRANLYRKMKQLGLPTDDQHEP